MNALIQFYILCMYILMRLMGTVDPIRLLKSVPYDFIYIICGDLLDCLFVYLLVCSFICLFICCLFVCFYVESNYVIKHLNKIYFQSFSVVL